MTTLNVKKFMEVFCQGIWTYDPEFNVLKNDTYSVCLTNGQVSVINESLEPTFDKMMTFLKSAKEIVDFSKALWHDVVEKLDGIPDPYKSSEFVRFKTNDWRGSVILRSNKKFIVDVDCHKLSSHVPEQMITELMTIIAYAKSLGFSEERLQI